MSGRPCEDGPLDRIRADIDLLDDTEVYYVLQHLRNTRGFGGTMFTKQDFLDQLDLLLEDGETFDDKEREALWNYAKTTKSWRMLNDASETNWIYVHNAIETALKGLGWKSRIGVFR